MTTIPHPLVTSPVCATRGLLGGHVMAEELKRQKERMQWYKGELLDLAVDLGDRLLPAFNTSTGIPFPKVSGSRSLNYGPCEWFNAVPMVVIVISSYFYIE